MPNKFVSLLWLKSRAILSFLGGALIIYGIWLVVSSSFASSFAESSRTPISARQILTNDFGWKEQWRTSLHLVYDGDLTGVIANQKIIMPVQSDPNAQLTALDIADGHSVWKQELVSHYGIVDSLATDTQQVYVAASFAVQAFRASDGHLLWATPELYSHARHEIRPLEQNGIVQDQVYLSSKGAVIYNIDAKDGAVKFAENYPLILKLKTETATYYLNHVFDLICIDNQSGRALWTLKTRGLSTRLTLIDSETLIVQTGSFLTSLMAVNPMSGKVLWQTSEENLASNYIVWGDTVYAIATMPAIVGYDVRTGHESGKLTLSGEVLDTTHAPEYWLVSTDSEVFAYFSDSQELIAFMRK